MTGFTADTEGREGRFDQTGMEAMIVPATLNAICPLCATTLASSSWVTHHGQRVHPSCWEKTGDEPDSIALRGRYGLGGDYFEAEAARNPELMRVLNREKARVAIETAVPLSAHERPSHLPAPAH